VVVSYEADDEKDPGHLRFAGVRVPVHVDPESGFLTTYNIQNTLRRTSYYGIISIGAAFVIISSGIDLSIGSVIGLIGCLLSLSLAAMGDLPPGRPWTARSC
jgi:ribose/xylose/arabinose/galactoside ABC-type transport system permease subunit